MPSLPGLAGFPTGGSSRSKASVSAPPMTPDASAVSQSVVKEKTAPPPQPASSTKEPEIFLTERTDASTGPGAAKAREASDPGKAANPRGGSTDGG